MINTEIDIRYFLKDNVNLPTYIDPSVPPSHRPWEVAPDGTISRWDTVALGTNAPTMDYLQSIDSAATAWWASYQYSVRQTPEWQTLVTDLNAYPALKTNLVNSVNNVADANTRAALNDLKALVQQLQSEIVDLKHVIGKNLQVEP